MLCLKRAPLITPEGGFRVELGGSSSDHVSSPVLEEVEKHSLYYRTNFCNKGTKQQGHKPRRSQAGITDEVLWALGGLASHTTNTWSENCWKYGVMVAELGAHKGEERRPATLQRETPRPQTCRVVMRGGPNLWHATQALPLALHGPSTLPLDKPTLHQQFPYPNCVSFEMRQRPRRWGDHPTQIVFEISRPRTLALALAPL
jgi:hypothetical protein